MDDKQQQIKLGEECGLSQKKMELLKKCADNDFNWNQLQEIRLGLIKLPIEDVEFLIQCFNKDMAWTQVREIRTGFVNGLSLEQIQMYAKPEYTAEEMYESRVLLEKYAMCL